MDEMNRASSSMFKGSESIFRGAQKWGLVLLLLLVVGEGCVDKAVDARVRAPAASPELVLERLFDALVIAGPAGLRVHLFFCAALIIYTPRRAKCM